MGFEELGIGIIGGIMASMIIGFFAIIYRKVLYPKIEDMMHKYSIKFDGEWDCRIEEKDMDGNECVRDFKLNLKQSGFRVKGTFIVNNKFHDNTNIMSKFRVYGIVSSGVLSAYYVTDSRKRRGSGTFLLEKVKGGDFLEGHNSGISVENEKFKSRTSLVFNLAIGG